MVFRILNNSFYIYGGLRVTSMKRFIKTALFVLLPFMLLGCTPDTETEEIDHALNEKVKTDDSLTIVVTDVQRADRHGWDYLLFFVTVTSNKAMGSVNVTDPPYGYNLKLTKKSQPTSADYISSDSSLAPNETMSFEVGFKYQDYFTNYSTVVFRFFKNGEKSLFFDDSFRRTWVLDNPTYAS